MSRMTLWVAHDISDVEVYLIDYSHRGKNILLSCITSLSTWCRTRIMNAKLKLF